MLFHFEFLRCYSNRKCQSHDPFLIRYLWYGFTGLSHKDSRVRKWKHYQHFTAIKISHCRVVCIVILLWFTFSKQCWHSGGSNLCVGYSPLLKSRLFITSIIFSQRILQHSASWWIMQWNTIGLSELTVHNFLAGSSYYTGLALEPHTFLPLCVVTLASFFPAKLQRNKCLLPGTHVR